jgi:tetratricopeptide (TPR) repeat protein
MRGLLFFLSISFFCCSQSRENKKQNDGVNFNKQAVRKLQGFLQTGDSTSLYESLQLYDKALANDSTDVISIQGKLTILSILGRFDASLTLVNRMLKMSRSNTPQLLISKALLFEKLRKQDSSRVYFDSALYLYDKLIEQKLPDSIITTCNRLYLIAIIKGKQEAMIELNQYLTKYPNDSTLKIYAELLRDFDRKTILSWRP